MKLLIKISGVPLSDKINLDGKEGEIIYSDLSKNVLTVNKVKKLLENTIE